MIRSKTLESLLFGVLFVLATVGIAHAQEGGGGGGGQPPPPPPPPPPSQSSGGQPPQGMPPQGQPPQGQNFQRDGVDFQKDGPNFQRDGANYQKDGPNYQRGPSPRGEQMMNERAKMMRNSDGQDDSSMSEAQQKKMEERQKVQMLKQADRMSKMFAKQLSQYRAQVSKLEAQGIHVSADCAEAMNTVSSLSDKAKSISDPDEIQELFDEAANAQHTLMECKAAVGRLSQLPGIMKTLQNMITRLEKAKVDVAEYRSEMSQLNETYNAIKAGSMSHEDLDDFFAELFGLGQELKAEYLDQGFTPPKGLPNTPPQNQGQGRGGPMNFLRGMGSQVGSAFSSFLSFWK